MKEIINIRAKINQIENRKTIQKVNEKNSWFFGKKKSKIDKPLARLTKKRESGTKY